MKLVPLELDYKSQLLSNPRGGWVVAITVRSKLSEGGHIYSPPYHQ